MPIPDGAPTGDTSSGNAPGPESAALEVSATQVTRGLPALPDRAGSVDVYAGQQGVVPAQIVVDPRLLMPATTPPAMQWTLRQIIQVLTFAGAIMVFGAMAGWSYGGAKDPVYAARSELIYFLEDAVPDGFLREDRRILTQLVTIESEAVLAPIAVEFESTLPELRDQLSVDVVDLSEVIRLDVTDIDPERALAINTAVLGAYQTIAAESDRRGGDQTLVTRRDELLAELETVDQETLVIEGAELADVELQLREESLTRELDRALERVNRLSTAADGRLTDTTTVDDRATINTQLAQARQRISELEQQLLAVRGERASLQRTIEFQLAGETPFSATANQQRDVALGVQEDSIQLEIDTVAERSRRLEGLLAEALVDNRVEPSQASIDTELAAALEGVSSLEEQLLGVRTSRAEFALSTATRPSLTRRLERLEQDLAAVESELASAALTSDSPGPIDILTSPVVLEEPVGRPQVSGAALGMIVSLPIAAAVAVFVRRRQLKQL